MKPKLIPILTAVCMVAIGFTSAPAKAVPTITISLDGFFLANEDGLAFADLVGGEFPMGEPLIPDVSLPVAAAMDAVAPPVDPSDLAEGTAYGLIIGLHYEVAAIDEPSPSTPRFWELAIDLGLAGIIFNDTLPDIPFGTSDVEDLIGETFPITGIPISDLFSSFSVDEAAFVGALIVGFLADECSPGATVITAGGDPIGACLFVPTSATTGDIFLGLGLFGPGIDSGEGPLLSMTDLFEPSPVFEDTVGILGVFDLDLTLTAVPEPGTLALFGLGLAGLGLARRKRMI